MADTIITNTPPSETKDSSGAAGWVVALVITAAVALGGYLLYQNGAFERAPAGDSTNINITNPPAEAPAPTQPTPPAE